MKKFNLSSIMRAAWKLFRKGVASFGLALKLAWANAKLNQIVREHEGITEETHSWAGWKALGYEVKHGESSIYSVMVADPKVKTGFRKKSYFRRSQVQAVQV